MNNNYFIKLFEERIAEYTGSPYVVLVDSCTNAIFLTLQYLKKTTKINGAVDIPNRTYIGVGQQIIHCELKLGFKEIKWFNSYKIGKLPVFDCAVGFNKNMYVGGQYQCLSFQQKKKLNIGKGGAILCDDVDAYKTLKRMAHDGRDGSIPVKDDEGIIMGWHMNMTPEDAARGILLLNQLNDDMDTGNHNMYPDISKYSCFKGLIHE